ncbi:MAG: hypothetical protein ACJ8CO_22295, partial [Microvirga sp.]
MSRFVAAVHGATGLRRAGGNVARGRTFYRQAWRLVMIRMLLVLAVIALGADALLNNGGYTQ